MLPTYGPARAGPSAASRAQYYEDIIFRESAAGRAQYYQDLKKRMQADVHTVPPAYQAQYLARQAALADMMAVPWSKRKGTFYIDIMKLLSSTPNYHEQVGWSKGQYISLRAEAPWVQSADIGGFKLIGLNGDDWLKLLVVSEKADSPRAEEPDSCSFERIEMNGDDWSTSRHVSPEADSPRAESANTGAFKWIEMNGEDKFSKPEEEVKVKAAPKQYDPVIPPPFTGDSYEEGRLAHQEFCLETAHWTELRYDKVFEPFTRRVITLDEVEARERRYDLWRKRYALGYDDGPFEEEEEVHDVRDVAGTGLLTAEERAERLRRWVASLTGGYPATREEMEEREELNGSDEDGVNLENDVVFASAMHFVQTEGRQF